MNSSKKLIDLLNSQDFPKIHLSVVWHVGTMDVKQKRKDSMEGNALSVSIHPHAWSGIARCSSSICFEITETSRRHLEFADILKIRSDSRHSHLRDALTLRAIQDGYLVPSIVFQLEYQDDELDETCFMRFRTKTEALLEAGGSEYSDSISQVEILTGTAAFCVAHKLREDPVQDHRELAWMSILQNLCPELNGVWWNELFDPGIYSAPRGGLFLDRHNLCIKRKALAEVFDADEDPIDIEPEQDNQAA
jgi:hypothetical protein